MALRLRPQTRNKGAELRISSRLGPRRAPGDRQQHEAGEGNDCQHPQGLAEGRRASRDGMKSMGGEMGKPEALHDFTPAFDK